MTSSKPDRETSDRKASGREIVRRDPYTVVVWERHGHWAPRLRRWVSVDVDWQEARSWQQCQTAAATGPGCVVLIPSDDTALGECVQHVQRLRRLHPETMVAVISTTANDTAAIGRAAIGDYGLRSLQWVLREAGAVDVAADAVAAERIARLIERDWRRRPPSGRPLTQLMLERLPWRSLATRR